MNKKIRTNLVKYLPLKLKKAIFKLKLYLKSPKLLFLAKTSFNTAPFPIIVLSLPRSGSSWLGSIMGSGEDVRYLREPATTHYTLTKAQKQINKRISVFDSESCDNWPEYQTYINDALTAKPNFTNSVIAYPKQWLSPKQKKSLIIKEVNPLVINYYLAHSVKLIYLVRHPFSVTKSYHALNWQSEQLFIKKFPQKTLAEIYSFVPNINQDNIWRQMGYLQGWIEAQAKQHLSTTHQATVLVRYEDICQKPLSQFKALFNFANINYSNDIIKRITLSLSRKDSVSVGDFSLKRNKEELTQIKIKPDDHENYITLMTAYQQGFNDYCKNKNINITTSYSKKSPFVTLIN